MSELFKEVPDDQNQEPKNYLEELVGETKKFKSVEDLARGKAESDAFIERLQREADELRSELRGKASLEEFINQMKSSDNKNIDQEEPKHNEGLNDNDSVDIQTQVKQILEAERAASRAQSNLEEVQSKLQEVYGNVYPNVLRERIRELGMSENEATALAERNPKAFIRLFADGAPQRPNTVFTPPKSAVSPGFKPTVQFKGQKYYDDLRRSDPNKYFSAEVQKEMFVTIRDVGLDTFRNS